MPLLKIKIRLILTLLLREYQLPRYRNDSIIYNFYFNFRLLLCINRKNLNCIFGFAVDPRDIVNTDFDDNNIYTLPRFDCNQFPFGKAISIL